MNLDIKSRLLRQRVITESDCWEWQGYRNNSGYGLIWYQDKLWLCHRLSCKLFNPNYASQLICRHKCNNPPCFNPEHIIPGSSSANRLDSTRTGRWKNQHSDKRYCVRGHLLEGDNLIKSSNQRRCKKCNNLAQMLRRL